MLLLRSRPHPPSRTRPHTPPPWPRPASRTRVAAAGHHSDPDPDPDPDPLSPAAAWAALAAFTAADAAGAGSALVSTRAQRDGLKAALLVAASAPNAAAGWEPPAPAPAPPPRLLLGVLASSLPVAARALRDYCGVLGVAYAPPPPCPTPGGVFVKWRPGDGSSPPADPASASAAPAARVSATPYTGPGRGVLVTLGTRQFGHLPLGLIDEDRAGPPPPLLG